MSIIDYPPPLAGLAKYIFSPGKAEHSISPENNFDLSLVSPSLGEISLKPCY
jgi:hypothetical protein